MLRWFRRDPRPKLQAEYERLLQAARDRQRSGDIKGYAEVVARAEQVAARLAALAAEETTT